MAAIMLSKSFCPHLKGSITAGIAPPPILVETASSAVTSKASALKTFLTWRALNHRVSELAVCGMVAALHDCSVDLNFVRAFFSLASMIITSSPPLISLH